MTRFKNTFTIAILLLTVFFGCKKEKEDLPILKMEHLQSWEKSSQISKEELINYWGNNDTANAFIQHEVAVYRITYQSTGLDGNSIILSGAILVPEKSEAKSIISIQHATYFADSESPSVNEGFSVVTRKSIFAAHGYIVFLPDYYGFGEDVASIHPYHHAESMQIASEDMILAGYEFLQNEKIEFNQKLFLAGYSEGAYATAALQQVLENKIDLPFTLTASSLGSGGYNLKATFELFISDINQSFGCLPCNAFFLQSYNEIYNIGHPLTYYFQAPYASQIENGLFLGNYNATVISEQLTNDPTLLFNPVFITNYYAHQETAWETALQANSIHKWQPKHPTFLTHNIEDNVAPFFNSEGLVKANESNANLTFLPIPNTNHFTGIFPWGILTMQYFDKF